MPDRTYKLIELVGTSEKGIDQAIENGIARAGQTLKGLDWFEVSSVRGQIVDGTVKHYQVTMKIGFRVMDPADLARPDA
jgi:flavin-binding protein dodecin